MIKLNNANFRWFTNFYTSNTLEIHYEKVFYYQTIFLFFLNQLANVPNRDYEIDYDEWKRFHRR